MNLIDYKIINSDFFNNCTVCESDLIYDAKSTIRECSVCHKKALSNAVCTKGHFVCDACHSSAMMASVFRMLLQSKETDPLKLSQTIWEQPSIHLHGPEHHIILPCVLLTAFHNNGGDINLKEALKEANIRGKQVPGGACGFWGVCGAAIGAGIYASIVTNSNPLNASAWSLPQILSSRCLAKMAEVGGPRCCKRTSRIAVSEAIKFTKEHLGVTIPEENLVCTFIMRNKECLKTNCPYYDLTTPQAVFL